MVKKSIIFIQNQNFIFIDPKIIIFDGSTHNIINESNIINIDSDSDRNINEPNITNINGSTDSYKNITDTNEEDKEGKISTLIIVIIVLGFVIIIGGISIGLILYCRKKKKKYNVIKN